MRIPNSTRRKALLVVDVQPRFLNDRTRYIVDNIGGLVDAVPYLLYVQGLLHADESSLWFKQHGWTAPADWNMLTTPPLGERLKRLSAISVVKTTRSIFKGEPPILDFLQANGIEETHIVGLDTYDCITASAHEAFDLGFFTYVIEECCQCSSGQDLHDRAITNLRFVNLTNNSCREVVDYIEVGAAG